MVCRRVLRLRFDPLPRVHRPGAGDSRHGGADPARGRRQVVDSWHVDGWRRDTELAQGPALRTSPRPRRRQPRLWCLARRRAHCARCRRSDPAQTTRPSQPRPALRGRHTFAAAAPRAQRAGARRRGQLANCSLGLRHTWLFDVREPTNPVSFATMPVPSEADYCAKGGNFGPHNLWENRPGAFQSSRFVFATYHNAGVRVFDIENPFQPREAGFFVPPDPERMFDPRPNRPKVIQSADCFVDAQGVMYLTDNNAGLYVLQFEGA